jgi:hypothetical protein
MKRMMRRRQLGKQAVWRRLARHPGFLYIGCVIVAAAAAAALLFMMSDVIYGPHAHSDEVHSR